MSSLLITAYNAIARGSMSALAGQAFSKAQLLSLASAATYTALSVVGEKATGADNYSKGVSWEKNIFVHLASLVGKAYITPKLTQKFFNTTVSNKMSWQLAGISLAKHFTVPLLIAASKKVIAASKKGY